MKIVIVDDDIFVSGALTTILEASGKVTVAASGTDGKEAAELYKIHQPDVLLMDIRMKEKSGLDASAEILEEFPDARSLLLSTFSDDEYIVKALKLGAKGYLLKQDYASIPVSYTHLDVYKRQFQTNTTYRRNLVFINHCYQLPCPSAYLFHCLQA